jgi:hypothetical protein
VTKSVVSEASKKIFGLLPPRAAIGGGGVKIHYCQYFQMQLQVKVSRLHFVTATVQKRYFLQDNCPLDYYNSKRKNKLARKLKTGFMLPFFTKQNVLKLIQFCYW